MKEQSDRGQSASCNDLQLTKIIQNIDNGTFELEIEFTSINGKRESLRIPRSIQRSPSELYRRLLDQGAQLPNDNKITLELLREVLESEPDENLQETERSGWHGNTFVHRKWTEGSNQSLRLGGQVEDNSPMDSYAGNLKRWKDGLKKACRRSSYLSFGIGVSFAAPLLNLIGEDEGVVFNFHGRSSSGKSLTCRASQSVFARANKNVMQTYDFTPRKLEELCFEYCDLMLVLDEAGRSIGNIKEQANRNRLIAFVVAGGHGKTRSRSVKDQGLENLSWRILGLTSSESPLEDSQSQKRADGERVRHIDIAIPRNRRGIFNRLKRTASKATASLAQQVENTIRDQHGVALRPYIKALIQNRETVVAQVNAVMEQFVDRIGAGIDPWERRFAQKFALVEAGMTLAAEYGVAPWTLEHARETVERVYRVARKSVASTQQHAKELVIRLARDYTDENLFPQLEHGQDLPSRLKGTARGFRRDHDTHRKIVALNPDWLTERCGSKALQEAVTASLVDLGVIAKGNDGKRHLQLAVKGFDRPERARWLCFSEQMLKSLARSFAVSGPTDREKRVPAKRRR